MIGRRFRLSCEDSRGATGGCFALRNGGYFSLKNGGYRSLNDGGSACARGLAMCFLFYLGSSEIKI